MAYKKRSYKKTYKKPTRYQNYSAGFGQLSRDVAKLKNLINVEFKRKDESITSTVSNAPTLELVNGLSKGDSEANREGNTVRWKSIQCQGYMKIHASAVSNIVRRIIFIDKQPNQAAPTASDVLTGSEGTYQYSFRELDHRKRFVILKDQSITLSQNRPIVQFADYYSHVDMITVYNTDTGNIADIETNSLYVMYMSDASSNSPSIAHKTRLRFIDN